MLGWACSTLRAGKSQQSSQWQAATVLASVALSSQAQPSAELLKEDVVTALAIGLGNGPQLKQF